MAREDFLSKLARARAIISKGPRLEEVFETVLDEFLKAREPKRPIKEKGARNCAAPSRYIAKGLRQAVRERDQFRCTFIAPNGILARIKYAGRQTERARLLLLGRRRRADLLRA